MTTRAKEISDLGITSLFTLDDNGNVGIGTDSPAQKLQIEQAAPEVRIQIVESSDSGQLTAAFHGYRSRGANLESPTAVLDGNYLGGTHGFGGHDGTGYHLGALIRANASQNWTTGAHGTFLTFSVAGSGSTTVTERMRINSSGNVLIGTTTDNGTDELQVDGSVSCTNFSPDYSNTVNANFTTSTTIIPLGALVGDACYIVRMRIKTYPGTPYYLFGSTLFTPAGVNGNFVNREVEILTSTHNASGYSMYVAATGSSFTTSGLRLRVTNAGQTNSNVNCYVEAKRIF